MPELPEVEALARYLREHATGHTINRIDLVAFPILKTYDPGLNVLSGRTVVDVRRYGKYLDVDTDGVHIVLHLARAGWLRWKDDFPAQPPRPGKGPLAARIRLEEGGFDVTEAGTTKRLGMWLVADPLSVPGIASLGVDPLSPDFTRRTLAGLVDGARTQIKGLLRDQRVIAGIGNAYSDEILHVARMSPYKLAASLSAEEVTTLYRAIVDTLSDAVDTAAATPPTALKSHKRAAMRVHGRAGEACPVCGDTVRAVNFADSAMQYCPTCQTGGKILADRRMSRLLK